MTRMSINGITGIGGTLKPTAGDDKRLKQTCSDFESLLVSQMLANMRQTIPENSLFGSSDADDIFQDMMDQQIAQNIAESGSIGIGKLIYKQVSEASKSAKVSGKNADI